MTKVVLVTGGAKRIGKSICKKFHENEFSIVCHYNSSEDEAIKLKENLNSIRKDSVEVVPVSYTHLTLPTIVDV